MPGYAKKCSLIILLLIVCCSILWSQSSSAVSILEKLFVIETEYFDIIYPKVSEQTAQHLANDADDLYIKAADFLGVKNLVRMPVVITQKTDVLNAYFTTIPYSRIVLYDTPPTENLAVFNDTLLSVFYHELIHAVSFKNNLRNICILDDFWSFMTMFDMPPSMSEGAAVLAESSDGFGRLNDSYSMHVVRQAKIENKFPDWSDVAGAYSLYTDGSLPYIFGGAFMEYMYRNYGAQKLTDFWNDTANINLTTYAYSFKKSFGISISDAWADFEKSIEVPVLEEKSLDFFDDENNNYLFSNLASSSKGLAWQDLHSSNVYYLPFDEKRKEQFLFTTDLESRLSFSKSGQYLIASGGTGYPNEDNKVKVFDFTKNTFVSIKSHLRDATVVDSFSNNVPMLVGVETEGQLTTLVGYELLATKDDPVFSIPFEYGSVVFNPVDIGNNTIAALVHTFGEWHFFTYNYVNGEQKFFESNLENERISNIASLHATDTRLYMSFAKDAQHQPVFAFIELSDFGTESLTLQVEKGERSGGVFAPVEIEINNESYEVAYISRFYETRELSKMTISDNIESILFTSYNPQKSVDKNTAFEVTNYNPLRYYFDGTFIPVIGSVNLMNIDESISPFSLGATMIFLDPVERLLFNAGTGYDIFKDSYTIALSSIFTEQNFTLNSEGYFEMSTEGFEMGATKLDADVFMPIGSDFNRIGLSNAFRFFYKRNTDDFFAKGNTIDNATMAYFTRLRRAGSSFYELLGFSLIYQFQFQQYFGPDTHFTNDFLFGHIVMIDAHLPRLLPFNNPSRFTVNLPLTISLAKYFNYFDRWELNTNVVLFSYEIQKAIPFLHVFFRRVTLDGGICYTHYDDNTNSLLVLGSLYTTTALNASLATGYPLDLGVDFTWDTSKKASEALELGLKFELNL